MTDETPAHRTAIEPRSGDTKVIGKDGKIRNVDADARRKAASPADPDPLDHDGDGHKGGSLPGEESTRRRGQRAE